MATEGVSGSAAGGQLEERLDLSAETDGRIAQAQLLADAGQLGEALALLAAQEKRCRVGNDNSSLVRVCEASVQLCHARGDHDALIATIKTLSTRRSQKTSAVQALVRTALPWCVEAPYTPVPVSNLKEKEIRDTLVSTLRDITDGKIFLERERAQLTRALASIVEVEGDIAKAASILQEVHVETYGSLSKRDKVEFILEQMRLTLAAGDFVRAAIVANKVSRKHLTEENMEDYKVRFFTLMTIYHRHEKSALDLAKDYHSIYSTPSILNDSSQWTSALQASVLFLCLSPYSNEQQDMMNRIHADTNLESIPMFQTILKLFLNKEIISYPIPHQADIESVPVFVECGLQSLWHDMLFRRVIQHNIRVVSLYYKRIQGRRLAELLNLEPVILEQEIAGMVSEGNIYAKMDRPADIVRFCYPKTPEAILSDWAFDIDQLLHLVETTTHLIHKEYMTA